MNGVPAAQACGHIGAEILHRETRRIALQAGIEFRQLVQQEMARGTADVAR